MYSQSRGSSMNKTLQEVISFIPPISTLWKILGILRKLQNFKLLHLFMSIRTHPTIVKDRKCCRHIPTAISTNTKLVGMWTFGSRIDIFRVSFLWSSIVSSLFFEGSTCFLSHFTKYMLPSLIFIYFLSILNLTGAQCIEVDACRY